MQQDVQAVQEKVQQEAAVVERLLGEVRRVIVGQRYLLEFTVDGQPMGSVLSVRTGHTAEIYGALGSSTSWMRMEIVGPDGPIAVLTPEAGTSDVVELEATTEPIQSATWCHVRGVDETGGMAWSSPVWMIPE